MDALWDRVKKNLVEWYGAAYDKTDELARIGRKKVEIMGVNRAIEKHLLELGGRVYDIVEGRGEAIPIADDARVQELIVEVKDLEQQLEIKEKEIEEIKKEKQREETQNGAREEKTE